MFLYCNRCEFVFHAQFPISLYIFNNYPYKFTMFTPFSEDAEVRSSKEKGRAAILSSRPLWNVLVRFVASEQTETESSDVASVGRDHECFSTAWRLIDAILSCEILGNCCFAAGSTLVSVGTHTSFSSQQCTATTIDCPFTAVGDLSTTALLYEDSKESSDGFSSSSSLRQSLIRSIAKRLVRDCFDENDNVIIDEIQVETPMEEEIGEAHSREMLSINRSFT